MKDELVKLLKQIDVVEANPVRLKNAGISDVYFNIKKAYGNPKALEMMSESLWGIMDKRVTCIAGEGHGGIPLATKIATDYRLNLTLIRSESKDHGKESLIDGYIPGRGDRVAIVDDVFTTGGSLKRIESILKMTWSRISGCYVLLKRGAGNLDVPLGYLMIPKDLLN